MTWMDCRQRWMHWIRIPGDTPQKAPLCCPTWSRSTPDKTKGKKKRLRSTPLAQRKVDRWIVCWAPILSSGIPGVLINSETHPAIRHHRSVCFNSAALGWIWRAGTSWSKAPGLLLLKSVARSPGVQPAYDRPSTLILGRLAHNLGAVQRDANRQAPSWAWSRPLLTAPEMPSPLSWTDWVSRPAGCGFCRRRGGT